MRLTSLVPLCLGLVFANGSATATNDAVPAASLVQVAAASPQNSERPTAKKAAAPAKKKAVRRSQRGKASWYGPKFKGRQTASGDRFNPKKMTAAHPSLPLGSKVRVTNLDNDKSAVLTVNDRMPPTPGRNIDVTKAAAQKLDFVDEGLTDVKIDVLEQPAK